MRKFYMMMLAILCMAGVAMAERSGAFLSAPEAEETAEGGSFANPAIEGEWEFTLDWHYAGDWSNGVTTETYTATLDGNTVTFKGEYDDFNIVAKFTAENTLTFDVAAVGNPADYTKTQHPFTDGTKVEDAGKDPENFVFGSFTATYNPSEGTITFTEGTGLAYGYANAAGEFSYHEDGFDFISATQTSRSGGSDSETNIRRWDFTKWSDATVTNLIVDAGRGATGWTDIEKKDSVKPTAAAKENCFWSINTTDEIGGLSANNVLIDELKGLKFGTNVSDRGMAIAVDYQKADLNSDPTKDANIQTYEGGAYLWLGGKEKKFFTIPAVKAGSTIKMGVESHNNSDGRGVKLLVGTTALKDADGNDAFKPKEYAEQTWTVTGDEAVDIIVDHTNGCHIYFIEVEQDQDALLAAAQADLKTVMDVVEALANDGELDKCTQASASALMNAFMAASNVSENDVKAITEATYALLNAKAALEVSYGDASIAGKWEFTIPTLPNGKLTFDATLDGNTVTFVDEYEQPIIGKFISATEIEFSKGIASVTGSANNWWQVPYVNTGDEEAGDYNNYTAKLFTAKYDAEAGTITFPEHSGIMFAYYTASPVKFNQFYDGYEITAATKSVEVEEPTYEVVGTYDLKILPTDVSGDKSREPIDIKVEVRKSGENYLIAEVEGNELEGLTVPFTYNEDAKVADFKPAYVGTLGSEDYHAWFAPFVYNDDDKDNTFIEPQPEFVITFDVETGFEVEQNTAGFAWYICENAEEFAPSDVYTAFYVLPADPTGLNKITNVNTKSADVYSLDGKLVRKQATTLDGLKGVHIVNGKKVILK